MTSVIQGVQIGLGSNLPAVTSAGFSLPGSQRAGREFVYLQVVLGSETRGSTTPLSICSHGLHRERFYSTLVKIRICMKFSVLREFTNDNAQRACESRKTCFPHETMWNGTKSKERNFMVTPCINNIQHFNYQLTQTTLKNVELLKHFKISKTAPTCFCLQGTIIRELQLVLS